MRTEFQKLIVLFEELEVTEESGTLTFSTRGSKSTAKLQLSFVIVNIVQCGTSGIGTAFPNKIDKTNQSDKY